LFRTLTFLDLAVDFPEQELVTVLRI